MIQALTDKANSVLQQQYSMTDLAVTWSTPRELSFGDLSTSVALQAASRAKKPPRAVAESIVNALRDVPGVEKADVAGGGYVNVWLAPPVLFVALGEVEASTRPVPVRKKDAPVIIEYSQPNIAKPLGVHHILGTVIGQSVSNLYEYLGYPVIRWNYIGDWGTQFGKLAYAMQTWGKGKNVREMTLSGLLEFYVQFHEEAEKNPSLEEEARNMFLALERGDEKLRAFWQDVVSVTKSSLKRVYDRLHVAFDLDLGESFYEDKMGPILELGKKKGVFKQGKEGALIAEFPEETNLPPYLVQKGDGATLYSTRDIAQMRYRMDTYHPAEILIFTDVAQKLHFEQLVATCGQLGWTLPAFENVLFGRMRFAEKSMSTRKGNILNLEDVLDEAVARAERVIAAHENIQTDDQKELAEMMGIGALVYGVLSQNRKMDIVFDWDKMLSFEGNSAPYLQYTHARGLSVLRKAGADSSTARFPSTVDALTDAERLLIRTLLQYPSVLEDARANRMPHKLANYLYQLCQDYNAFYNVEPILKAEGASRELRIALTAFSVRVLKSGARILTLQLPDRM